MTGEDLLRAIEQLPGRETSLARAYRKLGIHSRAELGARMAQRGPAPER